MQSKPKLVLTGRYWPRTDEGYAEIARRLDFGLTMRDYYLPVGELIYEYRVQYQTSEPTAQLSS